MRSAKPNQAKIAHGSQKERAPEIPPPAASDFAGLTQSTKAKGAFAGSYLFVFYNALTARFGQPTTLDILVSGVGLLILIEVVRRAFGRVAAFIILAVSLAALIGSAPITWHGVSRFLKGLWLTTEGVFGLALGISTSLAFLSLVLGAVADRLGFAKKLPRRLIGWLNRRNQGRRRRRNRHRLR